MSSALNGLSITNHRAMAASKGPCVSTCISVSMTQQYLRRCDGCYWVSVRFPDLTQERIITTSLERAGGEGLKTTDVPCNLQVARFTVRA